MMTVTRERFRSATVGQLEEVIERRERSHRGRRGRREEKERVFTRFFLCVLCASVAKLPDSSQYAGSGSLRAGNSMPPGFSAITSRTMSFGSAKKKARTMPMSRIGLRCGTFASVNR